MTGTLQPLDSKFAIVDGRGNPTEYFTRWAQQRQIDIGDSITLADLQTYLTAHKLIPGTGIQLTPDGDINDGVTIHADVQAILDEVTATRGAVLYRGLLGWAALLPGTAGLFLQTSGAGADPVWAAAGGGGGGSTPTIRAHRSGVYNASSVSVPWPVGTVAGDVVIVYWENGFAGTYVVPAGWSLMHFTPNAGNFTNQACIAKVMTAADITASAVLVSAPGSFNGWWCSLTLTGTTVKQLSRLPEFFDSTGSTSVASMSVTGLLAANASNVFFGFASTRGAMNMTVTSGLTIIETQNSANASGIAYTINPANIGILGLNETITCPVANNGANWTNLAFSGP